MIVYTLSGVHKLYTSQLIAVMVKCEKIESAYNPLNMEKALN